MVLPVPIVPETITVHLGTPTQEAPNVTLAFIDYIKNVASSEIYPTWPESAIRANIYAQLSFTLNRIFTEWYRSQGYDFDITSTTQFDHAFVKDRDIYENISRIVDDIFDTYIRKKGQAAPFLAPYCDGVQTQCEGLKQWGTVDLAEQGMNSLQILQYYYGDDIELVQNVPVQTYRGTYPGRPLRRGDFNRDVVLIQRRLNRISNNWPSIPKINPTNGYFGPVTERAVREFQKIFNLEQDGIVGKSTWYQISYVYAVVRGLAELESEGIQYGFETMQFSDILQEGDTGRGVDLLQYFLGVIGYFNDEMPLIYVTGVYDQPTVNAVKRFQELNGLPVTGIVDNYDLWDQIYKTYVGTVNAIPITDGGLEIVPYPGVPLRQGMSNDNVRIMQEYLNAISQEYTNVPSVDPIGIFGPQTRNSVVAFQREFGLSPDGIVGQQTWDEILDVYQSILRANNPNRPQFPGFTMKEGDQDINPS